MTGACRLRPPHLVSCVRAPSGHSHPPGLSPPRPPARRDTVPSPHPCPPNSSAPGPILPRPRPREVPPQDAGSCWGWEIHSRRELCPERTEAAGWPPVPAHPERSWGPSQTPSGCGFRQSLQVNGSGPGNLGVHRPDAPPVGQARERPGWGAGRRVRNRRPPPASPGVRLETPRGPGQPLHGGERRPCGYDWERKHRSEGGKRKLTPKRRVGKGSRDREREVQGPGGRPAEEGRRGRLAPRCRRHRVHLGLHWRL